MTVWLLVTRSLHLSLKIQIFFIKFKMFSCFQNHLQWDNFAQILQKIENLYYHHYTLKAFFIYIFLLCPAYVARHQVKKKILTCAIPFATPSLFVRSAYVSLYLITLRTLDGYKVRWNKLFWNVLMKNL